MRGLDTMPVQFAMHLHVSVEVADPVAIDITNERRLPALTQLMPPGVAWDLEPGSRLYQLLGGFARIAGRFDTWLRAAVRNLSPWTAEAELGRWERLLRSRPGPDATLAERRQQAGVRLRARGGQSAPYWRSLLEDLGYQDIEVIRLGDPFRMGDRMGERLQGPQWMFVLLIRATSIPALDALVEQLARDGARGSVLIQFEWK